ncbi:MAG: alpha-glucosidase/alpha-galactosidase [Verrucomicrobiota bacterium JB024]|nr:alpha-glucosidase/alpha-galactosidase [Verrucomicrobiota bacterium JB024]
MKTVETEAILEQENVDVGAAAHTQSAQHRGLDGKLSRPIKVTMLGAGSFFTSRLINDVLQIPGIQGGEIALVDIEPARLSPVKTIVEKVLAELKIDNWKVTASTDRLEVLPGTDYIVSCIEVAGLACVRPDNDIPLKYGIDQCIGDTIGPGGLFKGLRTIPAWLEVLRDAERLCPQAIVLNYTNPMSMMCLASGRSSVMPVVGLCHSVQGTSNLLAKRAGVPYEEMRWACAGINHLAWFVRLEHNGKNLYPLLMQKAREDLAGNPSDPEDAADLIRKDMMLNFGAFITESSGHLSEYLPYYRKRSELIEKYCGEAYHGEGSYYANNWPDWRKRVDREHDEMIRGERDVIQERSWEYASWIIEAREKNVPFRIHGNVMNRKDSDGGKLITNLPADGCVEVACMVDANGVQPVRFGALPKQMAALCDSNMRMFDLAATAAIEKSKEAAIHALMLDPLCSAVCSPSQIRDMALEMFEAEKDYLPGYK